MVDVTEDRQKDIEAYEAAKATLKGWDKRVVISWGCLALFSIITNTVAGLMWRSGSEGRVFEGFPLLQHFACNLTPEIAAVSLSKFAYFETFSYLNVLIGASCFVFILIFHRGLIGAIRGFVKIDFLRGPSRTLRYFLATGVVVIVLLNIDYFAFLGHRDSLACTKFGLPNYPGPLSTVLVYFPPSIILPTTLLAAFGMFIGMFSAVTSRIGNKGQ